MIVWGGFGDAYFDTGGRYNPSSDSWTATSTTNAPTARAEHSAIWNGSEMIVWSGHSQSGNPVNNGARYNPSTNSWSNITTTNAPAGRILSAAVWSGTEMIVWGGSGLRIGGRYNPATDFWIATCDINAPVARIYLTAVWTGSEMIVWGGDNSSSVRLNTGGRYSMHAPPPIQLLLEETGPVLDQAAALDSLLFLRDPFPVVNANALYQGADRNTRVILFVSNLFPGEPASSVVVHLVDSNNQSYDIPAADVRPLSNYAQVTFRLPDNLALGTCIVTVKAHTQTSNPGSIRIRS